VGSVRSLGSTDVKEVLVYMSNKQIRKTLLITTLAPSQILSSVNTASEHQLQEDDCSGLSCAAARTHVHIFLVPSFRRHKLLLIESGIPRPQARDHSTCARLITRVLRHENIQKYATICIASARNLKKWSVVNRTKSHIFLKIFSASPSKHWSLLNMAVERVAAQWSSTNLKRCVTRCISSVTAATFS
jgi:hypothetical protein